MSETGTAPAFLGAGRERRLHPLSWLFVLLAQLREFALPLIALLFFGRGGGDWWEWVGLGAAATLAVLAVVRYYTYRFRIADGELVIRSGILHRNVRHIPLARIQNVALRRNLLHRAFGVAEVRLESAVGGVSAEAQMRVLSLRDAQAMEALVRARGQEAVEALDGDAAPERGEVLLTLSSGELVRLGLTSNRGLLLGAAGAGAFSQFGPSGFDDLVVQWVTLAFGAARGLELESSAWVIAAVVFAVLLVALLRLVSVALVLLQFHGFELTQLDRRISVDSGLLTRVRSHAVLGKIQHWTLRETLLHRWFRRRSLAVETAALQAANETRALSDPAPIATPEAIDALLRRWLPWLDLAALPWRGLHPRAWRRMSFWPVLLTVIATALLTLRFGPVGLLALATLPFWVWRARRLAAHSAWAADDGVLAWRSGWLDRYTSFAEIGKLQGLQLLQSPFDRRAGMASVVADTAGANPFGHRLELHYLPEDEARALYARLAARLARAGGGG